MDELRDGDARRGRCLSYLRPRNSRTCGWQRTGHEFRPVVIVSRLAYRARRTCLDRPLPYGGDRHRRRACRLCVAGRGGRDDPAGTAREAGVSLVYLVYESRLKAKRPLGPPDERAPSLEKLDRINYHLLGWGFLMLSLAIVSGAIWADATWGHFWSWEPQELWSLVIWLLYAALLESRLTAGWRGRRVAALTIVVFTVLVGSFLGVSLINPGKHGGSFG